MCRQMRESKVACEQVQAEVDVLVARARLMTLAVSGVKPAEGHTVASPSPVRSALSSVGESASKTPVEWAMGLAASLPPSVASSFQCWMGSLAASSAMPENYVIAEGDAYMAGGEADVEEDDVDDDASEAAVRDLAEAVVRSPEDGDGGDVGPVGTPLASSVARAARARSISTTVEYGARKPFSRRRSAPYKEETEFLEHTEQHPEQMEVPAADGRCERGVVLCLEELVPMSKVAVPLERECSEAQRSIFWKGIEDAPDPLEQVREKPFGRGAKVAVTGPRLSIKVATFNVESFEPGQRVGSLFASSCFGAAAGRRRFGLCRCTGGAHEVEPSHRTWGF